PKFLALFLFLQQAEESSRQKSEWGKANWKQKRKLAREEGIHITKRRPAWLDEDFKPIPEAAKCLNRIFKLKLQGVGVATIAEKMNQEKIWERPNGWQSSYVKKIITNRAVIGECQLHIKQGNKRIPDGDPILDYYPQVISKDHFFAVQKQLAGNRGCGGRKDRCSNLFTRIIKCAYCGGTMQFVDKGIPPKGQQYLQCSNGYRSHKCKRYRIRYDECENLILNNCTKLNPAQVLPDPDEQAERCQSLRHRIDAKVAEKIDIERQIEILVDQIGRTESESVRDRYEDRIKKYESKQSEIEEELLEAEHDLSIVEQDEKIVCNWSKNLEALKDAIAEENAVELRLRLRTHIEELIDKIEVFSQGYREDENYGNRNRPKWIKVEGRRIGKFVPPHPQQSDDFYNVTEAVYSEFYPELWQDKMFREFVVYVSEQRKTKKGRFLRVFFKTGKHVDLVPEGSLASGMELQEDKKKRVGWSFISPKHNRMWQDFKTDYRKKKGITTQKGILVTT
nr:recombinase family protein [Planctomycetota bacterium]